MKNIIKYGLLSLVAAASVSCESFLNEKVVSGVSYDYLETKTGIETAVNGVYSTMQCPQQHLPWLPVPEEKAHGQEHQEVQQALHQHLPVSQLREPHQRIQNGDAPHPVAAEQDDEQRYEVGDAQQHQHPPTDPFFQKQIDDGGTANDGQEQHSYVNYHIQETLMSNQQNHVHEEMVI